jgi:8-amino-7-oxononanoate synthase
MKLDVWLENKLKEFEAEGRLREIPRVFEKPKLEFCSNDYLGLSKHPMLVEAAMQALRDFGTGSRAARLLAGTLPLHVALEKAVALWQNKEAALLFNSGYQAAVGVIPAMASTGVVFSDALNHASIVDACRLSRAPIKIYEHNNMTHLEALLQTHADVFPKWIVSESIFSMEGEPAPLRELIRLKEKYDAFLYLDEAHAIGLYGKKGCGLAEELGLAENVDLLLGTFGKALGSFGAFVAGSKPLMAYLVNSARSFIFTTSLPPSVVAANLSAVQLVPSLHEERMALRKKAKEMRQALKEIGFSVLGDDSPILALIVGDAFSAVSLSKQLEEEGIWVQPIRPPTVPEGKSRLRISLTANHSEKDLKTLLQAMQKRKAGVV